MCVPTPAGGRERGGPPPEFFNQFKFAKFFRIDNGSQQWGMCNLAKSSKGSEWSNITVNSQFFRKS